MKNIKLAFIILIASILCTSCYSTYQVEKLSEKCSDCNVINIKRKGLNSMLVSVNVYDNDKFVGKMGSNSYLSFNVQDGTHLLKFKKKILWGGTTYYKVFFDNTNRSSSLIYTQKTLAFHPDVYKTDSVDLHNSKTPAIKFN